jgi:hypothetical protein
MSFELSQVYNTTEMIQTETIHSMCGGISYMHKPSSSFPKQPKQPSERAQKERQQPLRPHESPSLTPLCKHKVSTSKNTAQKDVSKTNLRALSLRSCSRRAWFSALSASISSRTLLSSATGRARCAWAGRGAGGQSPIGAPPRRRGFPPAAGRGGWLARRRRVAAGERLLLC